ncbi:tRNA nuclease WapA precursor [compost metagenome]
MNHQNDAGVTTVYNYDALNRLTSVQDALNQTTRYTYDGTGQISKVTVQAKGGAEQTLNTKSYNEIGLPTIKQDGSSQTESLSYNALGQLSSRTDRNGSVFSYSYDESGQQKSMTVSGTVNNAAQTQSSELVFGSTSPSYQTTNQYTNDKLQSMQQIYVDSLNQVRNRYDIEYSSGVSVHASNIFNQRDVLGRITQLNDYYLNFYVNYQYNKQRLDKVQTNGSSSLTTDASTNVQYNYYANNLVKSITYPTLTDGSTLKTEYTYNKAMGWVETMTNSKGSNVLSSFSYGYDNNGNIVSTSEVRSNGAVQKTSYGYDALNRLTSITRPDGGSTTYTYDVRGNRQTLSDTSSASLDMTDTSYTYDLFNTLTTVTKGSSTTSFKYYADGLRYLKSTGTTSTQVNYDFNGQVITEEKLSGSSIVQQSTYVRGDRLLVKKDKTAGKDYYYLYNAHGDVIQIVDTSGNVVNSYSYDAWGNITSQTEGISNSFKYAGEMYDAETGLYYLRARYYDPSIGRFINEDTEEGQIDNPLSLNLYTYVANNPQRYVDPSGHMYTEIGSAYSAEDRANLQMYEEIFLMGQQENNLLMMQAAHDAANYIRLKYQERVDRTNYLKDGRVYKSLTVNMYNELLYGNAREVPLLDDPMFYVLDGTFSAIFKSLSTIAVKAIGKQAVKEATTTLSKFDLQLFAKDLTDGISTKLLDKNNRVKIKLFSDSGTYKGWTLVKDRAINSGAGTHGGSYYKLFDRNGNRWTLDKNGNVLRN